MVATVNPQGQITARLKYDSYGNIIQSSGTLPDYRYAGLFYHPATGLSLATWRAYDPKIGRWLSWDPIREVGGINLYGYVTGNPIKLDDVKGLAAGDLKCQGFSGGCQNGGSFGTTAMYCVNGINLCRVCAIKYLGVQNESRVIQINTLNRFLK